MSLDAPPDLVLDGTSLSVGIAAARFNATLTNALLEQVAAELRAAGVAERRLTVVRVPGTQELPYAVQALARGRRRDVVLALGVLIRGDTVHYQIIAEAATQALLSVSLDARVPVINGIVVAETMAQARERCLGKIARGAEFARAALEMAALKRRFRT